MRLLQKTIRSYLFFSVFILLVAIPVIYLAIKAIVREDADEHLQATLAVVKPRIVKALSNNTLANLNFADQDITLSVSQGSREFKTLINKDFYDSVSQETVPCRILMDNFLVNGKPWLLQVRSSMLDSEDLIASIVEVQVILLLVLLSGLFLINRNLSQRIWRPFYTTLEKLRGYKVEQSQPLNLAGSGINEFNDLNGSLEELTARMHRSFLVQKEFTENASHEMQTPLAIFQSKLELLMQTSPINEEQAGLIGDLADAGRRMGRLNKALILLTRIENQQFADIEPLALKNILQKQVVHFNAQAEQKHICISCEFREEPSIQANKALVEILTGNLLSNALRHNQDDGLVRVSLDSKKLIIQNTGRPSPLNIQQIFRRFFKESANPDSIGLGLQIVQQITNLYGWKIGYEHRQSLHSFTVLFD